MKKKTMITGISIAIVLLAGGCVTFAYLSSIGGAPKTENVYHDVQNNDNDANISDTDNASSPQVEENGSADNRAPSHTDNGNASSGMTATSTSIISNDVTDGLDVLESFSDSNDDVLDILDYSDTDYLANASSDTKNILYWLYQVTQGDTEGYIAANDIAIFNMMSESGDYKRIDGDVIPTMTGKVVRATRTDELIDKKTGKVAASLRYTIEQDSSSGMLRSIETTYDTFDVPNDIDEMYSDDADTDDGIDDNAAPIQQMPPDD